MTHRSIIIGVLCAAFMCATCFFNDRVIRQTAMAQNFMPALVFGSLIFSF